jgi:hypothetical protein
MSDKGVWYVLAKDHYSGVEIDRVQVYPDPFMFLWPGSLLDGEMTAYTLEALEKKLPPLDIARH